MSDLEDFLNQLVAFPTVSSDLSANKAALDWINGQLNEFGLATMLFEFRDTHSLVASTTGHPMISKLLLQAHLDVVPGNENQFRLNEQDGKWFGRGVLDMKFAIACYLQLVKELGPQLGALDLGIMITTDEELGGYNGVKYLLSRGYKTDVCVLPDGVGDWSISASSRGIWHGKLIASGKSAHGSRPWDGDNALLRLALVISEINLAFSNHPEDDVSVSVNCISSGEAPNQIPDYAEATFDVRYKDKVVYKRVKKQLEDITNAVGYVSLNKIFRDDDFNVPRANGYLKQFSRLIQNHVGLIPPMKETYGTSDARHFAKYGIPCIVTSPPGGDAHGDTEWVDKRSVEQFYEILKQFVLKNA